MHTHPHHASKEHSHILAAAVLLLTPLFLSSCLGTCRSPNIDYPKGPEAANLEIDRSLLTGEPCLPPCWQGLEPGVSTAEDVERVLKDLPTVKPGSIRRQEVYGFDGDEIVWGSSVTPLEYESRGIGRVQLDANDVVYSINLWLEYDLTIQDLINTLGPPDRFGIFPARPTCYTVDLVWLERGLLATISGIRASKDRQLIFEDTLVGGAYYFNPIDPSIAQYSKDWKGYEGVVFSTAYP